MNIKMKKAIAIILFLQIALTATDFASDTKFTLINLFLGFALQALLAFLGIFLLKEIGNIAKYNTWSYIWRFLLAKYLAFFSAIFISVILPFKFDMPSIPFTVYLSMLMGLFSVFYLWCFFSINRKAHLSWAIGVFRGY